jgi:hypothetical protein
MAHGRQKQHDPRLVAADMRGFLAYLCHEYTVTAWIQAIKQLVAGVQLVTQYQHQTTRPTSSSASHIFILNTLP